MGVAGLWSAVGELSDRHCGELPATALPGRLTLQEHGRHHLHVPAQTARPDVLHQVNKSNITCSVLF